MQREKETKSGNVKKEHCVAKGFFVLNLISWPKKIIVAKES